MYDTGCKSGEDIAIDIIFENISETLSFLEK